MRATERNFKILLTIFIISVCTANVVGARVITTGINLGSILLCTSGGAITYAFTFLCTDVVGEVWGKEKAKSMVKYGFIGQVFCTLMIVLTALFPATDKVMDDAYKTLLGQNWVFVIGSLCAYYASQSWDVFIFHKIRDKYIKKHGGRKGGRWLWNNGSTLTSQVIDTAIYATISFGLGLGWLRTKEGVFSLLGLMAGQYILKACLALLDTPVFYLLTREVKDEKANMEKEYQTNV